MSVDVESVSSEGGVCSECGEEFAYGNGSDGVCGYCINDAYVAAALADDDVMLCPDCGGEARWLEYADANRCAECGLLFEGE